jgi:hypothetical protein
MPEPIVTTCFRQHSLGCAHAPPLGLTRPQLMEVVTRGHTNCLQCGMETDLRGTFPRFPMFGFAEALFGLEVSRITKRIPASRETRLVQWDIGIQLPHERSVLYADQTSYVDKNFVGPRLLAQQNSHSPWPLQLGVYAPASEVETSLEVLFVMKPTDPMEPPIDLAVQAVGQMHRGQLNVASVLLAASVEASLRTGLKKEYARRSVGLEDRAAMGFASLLERARMLLNPPPGRKLVEALNDLTRSARNPAAHGRPVELTKEQVADWMVDVAVIHEWTKHAASACDPGGGSVTPVEAAGRRDDSPEQ